MTTGFTEEFLELIKGPPIDWASLQRVSTAKRANRNTKLENQSNSRKIGSDESSVV